MTRHLQTTTLAAAALLAGASHAATSESSHVCPSRVHVVSGALAPADIPTGFQATFSDSQVWLTGYSVFEGPPAQGASLVPDSGRGRSAAWKFPAPAADGFWLSCDYASGLVHLAVRADEKATSCRATFSTSGDPKMPRAEFTCK